ncbi:hypothetical protein [Microbacterium jejuense]|uniref:hypothetical protein n=1 Tax=Microbacterium jejuense TaxID=1263637 RepID=UPI0031EEB62C
MPARSRSLATGVGLALLAVGLLTACASPAGSGSTPTSAAPSAAASDGPAKEIDADVAWLDGGRMIGLVTQGSSTCIPVAGDVAYTNGVLDVELLDPPEATACTMDLVPRVTPVAVPPDVDPTQELEIRFTGDYTGDADVDGVAGLTGGGQTDYLPSAGWTGEDGQFVILTWGSSSCVPVISDVALTSPTEVAVTFADPPADQVCTADMAPRAVVAQVEGASDDAEVTAVLTGDSFEGVRVPIIGHD